MTLSSKHAGVSSRIYLNCSSGYFETMCNSSHSHDISQSKNMCKQGLPQNGFQAVPRFEEAVRDRGILSSGCLQPLTKPLKPFNMYRYLQRISALSLLYS